MKSKVLAFLARVCLNKLASLAYKQLSKYVCNTKTDCVKPFNTCDTDMIIEMSLHEISLKSFSRAIETLSSPKLILEVYIKNVGLYNDRFRNNSIKEEKTTSEYNE
nr:putative ORF1 [Marmot picobirnavirus]